MKKVGIITFHSSHNCGSMLQAYALQKTIKEKVGAENELINFTNKGHKILYSIFFKIRKPINILGNLQRLFFYSILKKSSNHFEKFSEKHLLLSEQSFTNSQELKSIDGKYNFFICGSDQVWNTKAADGDDAFFLNFVTKGRKIAYATSLAATNIIDTEETREHYKKLLSVFDYVSVREPNAKVLIETIYPRNIDVLLDPTLLVEKEEWEELIDKPLFEGKYIFYYAFSYDEHVNLFVEQMGKKYNMPVVIIDAKPWGPGWLFKHGFILSKQFGPLALLNHMQNATLVFTTSFHGAVFSTIFEKKFWFVDSPMHNKSDDRATSLLAQFGLGNRFVKIEKLAKMDLLEEVDYNEAKSRKLVLKEKSINFLKEALNVCN